ncbi:MAG: 7-carboxy-7-deazaguanine synthase [Saprospiraceae bacterium]
MYLVKEIFYSLQGEGAQTGRPAVFLRFAGCNLWNGREEDRQQAICSFCDTDFVGTNGTYGGKYPSANDLAACIQSLWPKMNVGHKIKPYVIFTGGEPLLQVDDPLIDSLHDIGFEIGLETNGTIEAPKGIDWICLSPKPNTIIKIRSGNELKFIYPQLNFNPEDFQQFDFQYFYIQPMDGANIQEHIQQSLDFCLQHPTWRLSIQTHKLLGIR